MTDIGEIYFLPPLMERLARVAPDVCVSTVRKAATSLKDEMEAGSVDLALGLLPDLKAGFFQRRLFRHRYVCMFRKGHPLDKRRITLAEFSNADHVVVVAAGTGHSRVDAMLDDSGIRRRIRLRVPHFVAVGHILRETDMIATVPERFAYRCAEPFGLSYVPASGQAAGDRDQPVLARQIPSRARQSVVARHRVGAVLGTAIEATSAEPSQSAGPACSAAWRPRLAQREHGRSRTRGAMRPRVDVEFSTEVSHLS